MTGEQRTQYDQQERLARLLSIGRRSDPRELARGEVETDAGRYCVRVVHLDGRIWWEALRLGPACAELLDEDHVPACVAVQARRMREDWL
jgi:hypothetical protein